MDVLGKLITRVPGDTVVVFPQVFPGDVALDATVYRFTGPAGWDLNDDAPG